MLKDIVKDLVFQAVHTVHVRFQAVIWHITGTAKRLEGIRNGTDAFNKPAHLQKIWLRRAGGVFEMAKAQDFLCTHKSFEVADYILRPNVSLLYIAEGIAYFVEIPEGMNVYNTTMFPFVMEAQKSEAVSLVTLPVSILTCLADQFDSRAADVIWYFHTMRSGTLMSSVFSQLPGWTVVAESQCIRQHVMDYSQQHDCNLTTYFKSQTYEDSVTLMIKTILMQVSRITPGNRIFWKTTGLFENAAVPVIAKHFPEHKMMFSYRNGRESAQAMYKEFNHNYQNQTAGFITRFLPYDSNLMRHVRTFYSNGLNEACDWMFEEKPGMTTYELLFLTWATNIARHFEMVRRGYQVRPVKFEHLMENRRNTLKELFTYCNIPHDHIKLAEQVFELDLQKVTDLSRPGWKRDERVVARCNKLLIQLELPLFDESLTLENSI